MMVTAMPIRFVLAALLVLLSGCDRGNHPRQTGRLAPDFTVSDDSHTVHLADYRGKIVVLNSGATWCAPFIAELPSLTAMQQQLPQVQVLAVSLDEDPQAYRDFLAEHKVGLLTVGSVGTALASITPRILRSMRARFPDLQLEVAQQDTSAQLVALAPPVGGAHVVERQGAQGRQAVRLLQPALPGITALRDVSSEQLNAHGDRISGDILKRARHVITEDERVLRGVDALERGDLAELGRSRKGSPGSLRDDYEVSGPELDTIVEAARMVAEGIGSRVTGAGFGDCAVSLVEAQAVEEFKRVVGERYEAAHGKAPALYVCTAEDGAQEVLAL